MKRLIRIVLVASIMLLLTLVTTSVAINKAESPREDGPYEVPLEMSFAPERTPTLVGDDIEFTKENGTYTVYLSGSWRMLGSFMPPLSWRPGIGFNVGPFCYIIWPNGVLFNIENDTSATFRVNGETIIERGKDLSGGMFDKYPKVIYLNGFRGIVPTLAMYAIKIGPLNRIRVIGFSVEEIDIDDPPQGNMTVNSFPFLSNQFG